MEFEVLATSYCVEIETNIFLALLTYDQEWNSDLCIRLREIGCNDVDFSGHYMNYIYFSIPIDEDTPEFKSRIAAIIEDELVIASEWIKNKLEEPAEY